MTDMTVVNGAWLFWMMWRNIKEYLCSNNKELYWTIDNESITPNIDYLTTLPIIDVFCHTRLFHSKWVS